MVSSRGAAAPELAEQVRRYLGAPFDLDAFAAFAATDPVLAEIVPALRGFRPPLVPDPFETLVTSITAQQISVRAAFSIRNRLIETFGVRHEVALRLPDAGAARAGARRRRSSPSASRAGRPSTSSASPGPTSISTRSRSFPTTR